MAPHSRSVWQRELRILTTLATPLVLSQVGMLMMGIVDIYMVGKLGPDALGAIALGHIWSFGSMVVMMGIVMGIDPIITQAHGAGDGEASGLALQRSVVLSGILALPLGVIWWFAEPGLLFLGQDPDLTHEGAKYCRTLIFSIPPFLIFVAMRHYLQGRERTIAPLVTVLIANIFNVLFNWVLIFGNLGFPALGIPGAALATGLSRITLCAMLVGWILLLRLHRDAWVPWSRAALSPRGLREIVGHGAPIGLQFGLENWAFCAAALLAGRLGNDELAAHTIVIRLASLSAMMPLGISIAAATRVGNLIGAGRPADAQKSAWIAIVMGTGVMTTSALTFAVLREWLPALFSSSVTVIAIGAMAMPAAAAFQLFDGVQIVAGGVLRGMGTTRPAAVFNLVGYYVFALPMAWAFAFPLGFGLTGIWWGLCIGLGIVSILLTLWIRRRGPATARPVRDRG